MTNEERKIRIKVAGEILGKVHSDICNESTYDVSRETTHELCDIIQQLIKFGEKL